MYPVLITNNTTNIVAKRTMRTVLTQLQIILGTNNNYEKLISRLRRMSKLGLHLGKELYFISYSWKELEL